MKSIRWALALLLGVGSVSVNAQTPVWQEYDKLIDSREAVGVLGPTLFGDSVNFYTGALSFSTTDVAIPGNFALPVSVTRQTTVGHGKGSDNHDRLFADWGMDLPNISGVFAASLGWVTGGTVNQRCSLPGPPPPISFETVDFQPHEYWSGTQLELGGGGGGELLEAGRAGGEILSSPTGRTRPGNGGPYYWLTSDWTYVSCLPSVANDSGEGFLAVTSNGTKYWFNWMASSQASTLKKARRGGATGEEIVARRRYALYATRVEDRFGNWVTYTYNNAATDRIHITSIDASDGRRISFTYNATGQVATATAGTQVWQYEYGTATSYSGSPIDAQTLTGVVLPDASRWTIAFNPLSSAILRYYNSEPGIQTHNCYDPGDVDDAPRTGTITHPSGAVGTFTVAATRFGRSNVMALCSNVTVSQSYSGGGWNYSTPPNDPNDDTAYYPIAWDTHALTQKQITGPGLAAATWNYQYFSNISWFLDPSGNGLAVCTAGDCISPQCVSDTCAGNVITQVWGPNSSYNRYTFGNSYRYNEGKLLKAEQGTAPAMQAPTSIAKVDTTTYQLAQSGQTFPTPVGVSPQMRSGAGFSNEYVRPQLSNTTTQDGTNFTNTVNSYDRFVHPTSVTKASSLGYTKTETTTYSDNLSTWVLGQAASVTDSGTGKVISQVDYDPTTALPIRHYGFGILQDTLTYNANGTVATVKDGNNYVTTLSNWKRGIPQAIQHPATPEAPAGATESAVVNDSGWITTNTDENGYVTGYGYDAMGRLASVTYPTADSTTWTTTTRNFSLVASSEYGIPGGHWKQTVQTGTGRTTTFYDARWHPVLTLTEDTANAATKSFVVNRYDAEGRLVFTGYPVASLTTVNDALLGTTTTYDALDRVYQVKQDSELGTLTTTTEYLTGFRTRVTNPRGYQTTTAYQVFDVPSTDAPVSIASPGGVTTTIVRDVFGKPKSTTRSGPGG